MVPMAHIVAGFATSFSPQLHVPVEMWAAMGQRDSGARALLAPDGANHTYAELEAMAGPEVALGLDPAEQARRHEQCQQHLAELGRRIRAARLDALIVFTDDEHRLFDDDHFPAVFCYTGENVPYVPNPLTDNTPPPTRAAAWAYGREPQQLPGAPELATHILEALPAAGYDVSRSRGLKEGVGIGHHIGFVNTRLLEGQRVPLFPILFNASFPPNVLTAGRFFGLGQAIGAAVTGYQADLRVGVLAVGGFTHPVIDEALDRRLLRACQERNQAELAALPEGNLRGGNGQGRVWIAVAGAVGDLKPTFGEYVPAYRSAGGTGCGMGFAAWA